MAKNRQLSFLLPIHGRIDNISKQQGLESTIQNRKLEYDQVIDSLIRKGLVKMKSKTNGTKK